jgi:hypothetical protein
MEGANRTRAGAARSASGECCSLVAAYREGLGLAAVAIVHGPHGLKVSACGQSDKNPTAAAECVEARWWCRDNAAAERVAAAAAARLRRRQSPDGAAPPFATPVAAEEAKDSALLASASVLAAAKQLRIALQTDQEILAEAMNVAARVDAEIRELQESGGLKSLNKAYRNYRLEACARGEHAMRYDGWMRKYRENLVRQIASTLRLI